AHAEAVGVVDGDRRRGGGRRGEDGLVDRVAVGEERVFEPLVDGGARGAHRVAQVVEQRGLVGRNDGDDVRDVIDEFRERFSRGVRGFAGEGHGRFLVEGAWGGGGLIRRSGCAAETAVAQQRGAVARRGELEGRAQVVVRRRRARGRDHRGARRVGRRRTREQEGLLAPELLDERGGVGGAVRRAGETRGEQRADGLGVDGARFGEERVERAFAAERVE